MVRNYIPLSWRPDFVPRPPKMTGPRCLQNRYAPMVDSTTGAHFPAHGPMSHPSTLAYRFRNQGKGAHRCTCCTNEDFVDLFHFARVIGCSVFTRTLPSAGGKACTRNVLFVPYEEVPRHRKLRAGIMRGAHTGWGYHALRGKESTPNGYDYRFPETYVHYRRRGVDTPKAGE